MRAVVAVVLGAVVAAVAALVLGEYELTGVLPVVAGLLVGLAVAEAVLWPVRASARALAPVAALLAAGALLWAGWISVRHSGRDVPGAAWFAAALAAASAGVRTWTAPVRSAGSGNRREP